MKKILINAHEHPDFVNEEDLENSDGLNEFWNTYLIELDFNLKEIKDINTECFYITVFEIDSKFTLDDKRDYYWKVVKGKKILEIWNTEYDSRGITFYDTSCIQSELVFYLGNLCDMLKEYIMIEKM